MLPLFITQGYSYLSKPISAKSKHLLTFSPFIITMKKVFYTFLLLVLCASTSFSQQVQTITSKIAAGNDDAEVSTSLYVNSSDLELGGYDTDNNGKQYVALRFQGLALPTNATVRKAYIQFTTKSPSTTTASLTIKCQAGNAAAYSTLANIAGRTYVSNIINWNPPAWTIRDESNAKQQTPDLSTLIQAAIATGWQSGGALSFKLEGNATVNNILNARSYEFNTSRVGVPQLTIEYQIGDPCATDATPPTFANCPANINLTTSSTTAVATWTAPSVTDNCTANITPSVTTAPTLGLSSGSAFPIGTTTVTYSAKDAANNNAVNCVFTVTVTNPCANDVVAPVFANCPTNINLLTTTASAVATWTAPSVSDNCTPNITPSVSSAPTAGLGSGTAFPLGTTTITYSAKDAANNNAANCVFTVTVKDAASSSGIFINELAPKGTIGNSEDWIELYNDNTTPVSTDDIFITGKKTTPYKWRLKGLSIPAKGFLVLVADGDTLKGPTHIDLKLSSKGESVFLFRNVNAVAVELAAMTFPALPDDEDNVTFGVDTEGGATPAPAALTKFLGGTRGTSNTLGKRFLRITNNVPRGIVTTNAPIVVTLTPPAGSTLRYTTDYSIPSQTVGNIYTGSLNFNTTTVLKTFAYSNTGESNVESFTYIYPLKGSELTFPNLVTQTDYENGLKLLPIVSISTNAGVVDTKVEKICSFEYINKFGENKSTSVISGVEGYGNDSYLNSDQKNLRLSFKSIYGFSKFRYPIFKKDDVDTYTPADKFDKLELKIGQDGPNADGFGMVMTSQGVISKTMRELGNIDLHTQYVHAFVNGKYHGVYTLKEKYDEKFAAEYYGGEDTQYDVIESSWTTGRVNEGTITNWNALKSFASQFRFQDVKRYLNVTQLIDMMMTMMYFDNEWEYRAVADKSLVTSKFTLENHDTDGALVKISDGNEYTYDNKWSDPNLLVFNGPGVIFGNLYRSNNKEFKTLVRDRVYEAFQKTNGALTVGRIKTKLEELKSVIRPVFGMELARFNKTFYNDNPYFDEEYDENIAHLPIRYQYNLDKWRTKGLVHTLLPITFNQPSGTVTTPVLATNPNAIGSIYYTLNGSDPMGNDGVINPLAKLYTTQLALNAGVNKVVARVYANSEFGPKTTATYTSATVVSALQIAQIMTVDGRIEAQKGVLNWVSQTSQLPDYFIVEKLNKTGNFEQFTLMNALYSNKRDGIESYQITDDNLQEGDNIYRIALFSEVLKTPQYSEIVRLRYQPAGSYAIYPNPTSDFVDINLSANESKSVKISIFNSIGKLVYTEKIEHATANKRLNIEQLEPGQYFMSIEPEGKRTVMKKLNIVR